MYNQNEGVHSKSVLEDSRCTAVEGEPQVIGKTRGEGEPRRPDRLTIVISAVIICNVTWVGKRKKENRAPTYRQSGRTVKRKYPRSNKNLTPILNIRHKISSVQHIRTPSCCTHHIPQYRRADPLLHYLTSSIMKHGRRSKAARTTSRTLLHLHSFTRGEPLPLLREAILAASPAVKCLTHRHGAKNVHKPVALGEKQKTRFAVQWILEASDSKPGKTSEERLAREIIAVLITSYARYGAP